MTKINWAVGSLLLVAAIGAYFFGWGHAFSSEKKAAEALMSEIVTAQKSHYQLTSRYVYFSADASSMRDGFQELNLNLSLLTSSGFVFDAGAGEKSSELVMRAIASANSVKQGELAPLILNVKIDESGAETSRWL